MFRMARQVFLRLHFPLHVAPLFVFFLAPVDDPALTVQFNIYTFPSVCVEGGWLSCVCFTTPDSSLSAFKALQAV